MTRSFRTILAFATMLCGLLALQTAHAATQADLKGTSVVLVHGAFADGSSWNRVIPILEAHGLHVVAVQNPLSSLADDVAATKRVIDQQKGPVVLVGHSWGGVVISQAGNDDKVKSLVYVAAFAPDANQSIADITQGMKPPAWANELKKDSAGYLTLSDKAVRDDFALDLPAGQQRIVAATQGPWFSGSVNDKVTQAAWHEKPSYFVIPGRDKMIDPHLQAKMATQIHAQVTRVDASHVAMLSQPEAVANAILAAARNAR